MRQVTTPLVSIVTPCRNNADFLGRCIDSVLAQDHPRVEHVVQDGASTDGTVALLESYGDRVDWVSEPDRGQNDGLDRALKRCRGDIVLVLNADDALLPHAASWAVTEMARHPEVAVIYGDQYLVDESDNVVGTYRGPEPYRYDRLLCVELVPPAQAAFIRRSALEAVGMGTDPTLKTCPDFEMWVRIGRRFAMQHVSGFVCNYRHHTGSGSRQLELLPQLVADKRTVMDRLFDDPDTPRELRRLRRRAHVGLEMWALQTFMDITDGGGPRSLLKTARLSTLR